MKFEVTETRKFFVEFEEDETRDMEDSIVNSRTLTKAVHNMYERGCFETDRFDLSKLEIDFADEYERRYIDYKVKYEDTVKECEKVLSTEKALEEMYR